MTDNVAMIIINNAYGKMFGSRDYFIKYCATDRKFYEKCCDHGPFLKEALAFRNNGPLRGEYSEFVDMLSEVWKYRGNTRHVDITNHDITVPVYSNTSDDPHV
ncbi:MAG: hypothetical protein ABIA21_02460 [Candidatus Aenigmatarchaeota archaeon]